MMIGSTVGGFFGLVIIIAIVWWFWKRRNSDTKAHTAKQNAYGNTGGTTILMTTNQTLPTYGNENSFNNSLNPVPMQRTMMNQLYTQPPEIMQQFTG